MTFSFKSLKERVAQRAFACQLNEVLDSNFDVYRNANLETKVNKMLGDKLHPEQTRVFQSGHMKQNGHAVLKLLGKDKVAEYHLLGTSVEFSKHKIDPKSMLHCMKIIHDNSSSDFDLGRKVLLQGNTDDQHKKYGAFANRLANKFGKTVTEIKDKTRLDGLGSRPAHLIESVYDGEHIVNMIANNLNK